MHLCWFGDTATRNYVEKDYGCFLQLHVLTFGEINEKGKQLKSQNYKKSLVSLSLHPEAAIS